MEKIENSASYLFFTSIAFQQDYTYFFVVKSLKEECKSWPEIPVRINF